MTNTLGAVCIFDGEVPRTFTAKARTAISGGQFVVSSGTANVVGSGASSFDTSDIIVDILQDSASCNGIALNNAESGANVTIATRGNYLVRSAGVVSGGALVIPVSGPLQGVGVYGAVGSPNYALTGTPIGRAITASASGTSLYALVSLNV
jgi:hypothetical protein